MRFFCLVIIGVSGLLSACQSASDSVGDARSFLGELGSGFGGGISSTGDTYGTNRRMDVYGGVTSPSLPTIGRPGFGK